MKKIVCLMVMLILSLFFLLSCGGRLKQCSHENFSEATCTDSSICLDCGVFVSHPLGHTPSEWIVKKEATKSENGLEYRECVRCKMFFTERVIYAFGSEGLEYGINKQGVNAILGPGTCTDTDIIIPEYIDGSKVSFIDDLAFENCSYITSITIPQTVGSIGDGAFWGCTGLTEITIPETVLSIGGYVFWGCDNLRTVYYNSPAPNNTDGTKRIFNNSGVTRVVFGGQKVPSKILYYCDGIEEVVILDTVTEIEEGAFCGCSTLKSVDIPEGIRKIGRNAFQDTAIVSIYIPDSVTSIEYEAFRGCLSLKSVRLSPNMTEIESSIFQACYNICDLEIPEGVVSIMGSAFSGCDSIESLVIPDSVTFIDPYAFRCQNLKSLEIGSGLLYNEDFPFLALPCLEYVVVDEDNQAYRSEDNCVIERNTNALVLCNAAGKIPSCVVSIKSSAFSYNDLIKEITIPENVSIIEDRAFAQCGALESITFEGYIVSIGERAFEGCEKLTKVEAPKGIGELKKFAFLNCKVLKSIDLSIGTKRIGDYAFASCPSLVYVKLGSDIKYISGKAFVGDKKLTRLNYSGTVLEWSSVVLGDTLSSASEIVEIVCIDGTIKLK